MNAAVHETYCPDTNDLAAYLEGRLDSARRLRIESHMADCAECRDVLLTFGELESAGVVAAPVAPPLPWRRRALIYAAPLAAAAVLPLVFFLTPARQRYWDWDSSRALTAAARSLKERPTHGRTSVESEFRDRRDLRGAEEGGIDAATPLQVAADLSERAETHPTVSNLHAAGVSFLMLDNTKPYQYKTRGVELLEQALVLQTSASDVQAAIAASTDALLLNDLAAGYDATGKPAEAKRAIERAWALSKTPTIAFTRAAILNTGEGWNDYLKLDSTSEWAAEARTQLNPF